MIGFLLPTLHMSSPISPEKTLDLCKRPNLTVISKTLTDKIIMEGTTAKGIQVSNWKNAQDTETIYGDEIILSGGAINSPSLLQLRIVFYL